MLMAKEVSRTAILRKDISRIRDMFSNKLVSDFPNLKMPSEWPSAERLCVSSLFGRILCANSIFFDWAA